MIIDTSAIIAILNDEPERRSFNEAIEKSDVCLLSTAGFVEASMVMENNRGYEGLRDFDLWMATAGMELAPVDADQAQIARQAFRQYGKVASPSRPEFWRLFFLCPRQSNRISAAIQRGGFHKDRYSSGNNLNRCLRVRIKIFCW